MKAKELKKILNECNDEAEVNVIAHCFPYDFTVSYGGGDSNEGEGVDKSNLSEISLYVDELCTNEQTN